MSEPTSPKINEGWQVAQQRYRCARLGGVALVTLKKYVCEHQDPAETHVKSVKFSDCQHKFDCGLLVWDQKPHSFHPTESFDSGCDACRTINLSGQLAP